MELDERKLKILQAIIRTYLETGEPVGSRTISKYSDLNLSSATIRNEMSDLEEMGYILQPHTSAGRIPSDKGYRLYVDTMLDDKAQEVHDMKAELTEKAGKIDDLLKRVAKLLAVNTNYATMVSGPRYASKKVKFIQLTLVGEAVDDAFKRLLKPSIETEFAALKMIHMEDSMDQETLLRLNFIMNTTLNGLDVMDMNLAVIQKIKEQMGAHNSVIDSVLEIIGSALTEDEDLEIYTSGATNILKYPELADKSNAAQILSAFEEKKDLNEWIEQEPVGQNDDNHAIQVYIGGETQVESMKDCSLVTATYRIDDGVYGKVGIVGPKRMDYDKVVATLQSMMEQLDDIFKDKK